MSDTNYSSSFSLKDKPGPHTVGIVDNIFLDDKQRDRQVPLKIYYPQEAGSYPLIIFSHGTGGSKDSFSYLSNFCTSYGYVCIHPTHLGSDLSVLQKVGLQALIESTNDPKTWQDRPQDISFIIDSLEELERQIPALKGKIDRSSIGVSGHSYGAYATMLLAGAFVSTPWNEDTNFADDRIRAFLAISPQGTNRLGLNKQSWRQIEAPTMTVSGSRDQGWERKPPSWRIEPFNYMPPGNKYHAFVEGATHFSFDNDIGINRTGQQTINKDKPGLLPRNRLELDRKMGIQNYLQSISMTFWDAYLKKQEAAKENLRGDALQTFSNGEIIIFLK